MQRFELKINKALKVFNKAKNELETIIEEMTAQKESNEDVLKSIQDQNKQLTSLIDKNTKTVHKISDLLE